VVCVPGLISFPWPRITQGFYAASISFLENNITLEKRKIRTETILNFRLSKIRRLELSVDEPDQVCTDNRALEKTLEDYIE